MSSLGTTEQQDCVYFCHVLHKIITFIYVILPWFFFLCTFLQDAPNAHRGKHIVFDSDSDNDVEEDSNLSAIRGSNLSVEESEDAVRKNQNQQVVN